MSTYTIQQGDGETIFQLRQHTAFAEVLSNTYGQWQEIQCIWPLQAHTGTCQYTGIESLLKKRRKHQALTIG